MKIAIVAFANLKVTPFLQAYTKILNKLGLNFDIIMWNRRHIDETYDCHNMYVYSKYMEDDQNKIIKLWNMKGYSKFVEKVLKKNNYDRVVILSSLLSVFMKNYLVKKLSGRYVLDIRDHSYEHIQWYYNQLDAVMGSSCANVISSDGFKEFLPKQKTILNHNNNIDINSVEPMADIKAGKRINISFVGNIRYFSAYKNFLELIANCERIEFSFYGYGQEEEAIKAFCKERNINNVHFYGEYSPGDKMNIIKSSDIIFNVYGTDIHVKYAMSNKYYDALYFKKPLLVNKGTTMAEMSKGIAFEYDKNTTVDQLLSWYDSLNNEEFSKICAENIAQAIKDNEEFESAISNIFKG